MQNVCGPNLQYFNMYKVEYSVYSMEVNMKINNLDPTFLYIHVCKNAAG